MAIDRNTVPASRKWRLEDLFSTPEAWEACYADVEASLDFSAFEGTLGTADGYLACMRAVNAAAEKLERLYVYASMKHDEDTRRSDNTALYSRARFLATRFSSAVAWIGPELTSLDDAVLAALAADPALSEFDYTLRRAAASKPHTLSRETEQTLSMAGSALSGCRQVFSMLNNADFPFPTVKDENGKPVTVTHGVYGQMLRSTDRGVRRRTFKAFYAEFIRLANTITAAYAGQVDADVFSARAHRYPSALAAALDREDVDESVYRHLIAAVHRGLPALHRYYTVRKKMSGLSSQHMYDLYTAVVPDAELRLDYEQAFALVKEGLAPLGKEYGQLLQKAHDEGWIDVEETEGKRSGAYSTGAYGAPHPYVLLNYHPCTSDVFTIAHELGHAMHTWFSSHAQPQEKADYRIFVAEVASTVNEILLLRHLLRTTDDRALRKYLLSYYMDTLKGTMFRQTQFAEFEAVAHDMAEKGQPLTAEALCKVYYDLNRRYYGRSVVSDPEIAYEWARIPHFYTAFYVYKYATGIISAVAIVDRIERLGEAAVRDYFGFLSSGGSDSPVELLKLAGVDLTGRAPFDAAIKSFSDALDEFAAL
ncbi:MAG: oligoendopeptidase F [Clostridia bacterium]|nr:oligoendopeptidase F [Clostridia bacterium]